MQSATSSRSAHFRREEPTCAGFMSARGWCLVACVQAQSPRSFNTSSTVAFVSGRAGRVGAHRRLCHHSLSAWKVGHSSTIALPGCPVAQKHRSVAGRAMCRGASAIHAIVGLTVASSNSLHGASASAWPNTSVKASPNGGPPGPGHRYAVHSLWPGPGVPPSVPPYLER